MTEIDCIAIGVEENRIANLVIHVSHKDNVDSVVSFINAMLNEGENCQKWTEKDRERYLSGDFAGKLSVVRRILKRHNVLGPKSKLLCVVVVEALEYKGIYKVIRDEIQRRGPRLTKAGNPSKTGRLDNVCALDFDYLKLWEGNPGREMMIFRLHAYAELVSAERGKSEWLNENTSAGIIRVGFSQSVDDFFLEADSVFSRHQQDTAKETASDMEELTTSNRLAEYAAVMSVHSHDLVGEKMKLLRVMFAMSECLRHVELDESVLEEVIGKKKLGGAPVGEEDGEKAGTVPGTPERRGTEAKVQTSPSRGTRGSVSDSHQGDRDRSSAQSRPVRGIREAKHGSRHLRLHLQSPPERPRARKAKGGNKSFLNLPGKEEDGGLALPRLTAWTRTGG